MGLAGSGTESRGRRTSVGKGAGLNRKGEQRFMVAERKGLQVFNDCGNCTRDEGLYYYKVIDMTMIAGTAHLVKRLVVQGLLIRMMGQQVV